MKYARKLEKMQLGQREDWNSLRETKKGKMYEKHAVAITSNVVRFGRHISLNPLSSVPETPFEERLLRDTAEKLHKNMEAGGCSSKKLERLHAASRVLRISQNTRKLSGRPPHSLQLLGTMGLLYGLNSDEVKKSATYMNSTSKSYPEDVTWTGSVGTLGSVIRTGIVPHENYPTTINAYLAGTGLPSSSKHLCNALNMTLNLSDLNRVNTSLQLLEVMGLVKKLPPLIDLKTKMPSSVWISREGKPSISAYVSGLNGKSHYLNTSMEVLNILLDGPKKFNELYKLYSYQKSGNSAALYSITAIGSAVEFLERAGLVESETIKRWGHPTMKLWLTSLGRELWNETIITGMLPENLIKLILGEKEVEQMEPKPVETLLRTT
jgi:hypothetical protein